MQVNGNVRGLTIPSFVNTFVTATSQPIAQTALTRMLTSVLSGMAATTPPQHYHQRQLLKPAHPYRLRQRQNQARQSKTTILVFARRRVMQVNGNVRVLTIPSIVNMFAMLTSQPIAQTVLTRMLTSVLSGMAAPTPPHHYHQRQLLKPAHPYRLRQRQNQARQSKTTILVFARRRVMQVNGNVRVLTIPSIVNTFATATSQPIAQTVLTRMLTSVLSGMAMTKTTMRTTAITWSSDTTILVFARRKVKADHGCAQA